MLIIWYYTVHRNCKCSLQNEHHTYHQRGQGKSTGTGLQPNMLTLLRLLPRRLLFPVQGNEEVDWLSERAAILWSLGRSAFKGTLELSSRGLKGEGVSFPVPTTAEPAPFCIVCASRHSRLLAPMNAVPTHSLREDMVHLGVSESTDASIYSWIKASQFLLAMS